MIRKCLLGSMTLMVLATSAFGADLAGWPDEPYTKAAALVQPAHGWSGFYVGGHVGAGWSVVDPTFADPRGVGFNFCGPCFGTGFGTQTFDQKATGVIGGFHGGYNWQAPPNWLVGLEGDFTGSGLKHTTNAPLIGFAFGTLAPFNVDHSNLNFQTDINWLASIRGRLGYVNSNWLFYGTGGVAFADIKFSGAATCPITSSDCAPVQGFASFHNTRTGWTAGAGAEWNIPSTSWRALAEYLFYEFDSTTESS